MTSPTDIILYRTLLSLNFELVYEKKNRSLVFSDSRKIPTLGSTVQWETCQASFSTGMMVLGLIFFCPHWTPMMDFIYLTYSYQPVGKIKNDQPHAGHTSICDVIVMLKRRHHIASQRIQDFLESFCMFYQYRMPYLVVSQKKASIVRVRMG